MSQLQLLHYMYIRIIYLTHQEKGNTKIQMSCQYSRYIAKYRATYIEYDYLFDSFFHSIFTMSLF